MFSIVIVMIVSNVSSSPAPDKHVHRQEEYQIKQKPESFNPSHFLYSQEPPESKIPQIGLNWPQECTRLLPICTYLQYSRLRPRPRLRLSQEHPRIIIHSYPKQQHQTQNAQQTGNTSNSKVPKRRNIKTPFPFQKA